MSARRYPVWLFVLAGLFVGPRSSSADPVVIYSNFGPAPGYLVGDWVLPLTGPTLTWANSDENVYWMGFRLAESARLTSITVPIVWAHQLPSGFSLSVRAAAGEQPLRTPEGLLERLVLPLPPDAQPETVSLVSANSVAQPLLTANTLYFLSVFATGPLLAAYSTQWPWNNAGVEGPLVNFSAGGIGVGRDTLGAFQLEGEPSPVPEPGTMLLLASGAGLVIQRARHRRARA